MVGFSGILGTVKEWKMDDERQINRWKKIVSRFRGKLVKMIKDAGSKFDDYLISPKIRQTLLHWGYELTKKDFLMSWQINKKNLKKNIVNEKWEIRNEKWEMRNEDRIINKQKNIF